MLQSCAHQPTSCSLPSNNLFTDMYTEPFFFSAHSQMTTNIFKCDCKRKFNEFSTPLIYLKIHIMRMKVLNTLLSNHFIPIANNNISNHWWKDVTSLIIKIDFMHRATSSKAASQKQNQHRHRILSISSMLILEKGSSQY